MAPQTELGSASLATDAAGRVVSEMRYTPYGEMRSGTLPTDRRFTGQRYEAGTGLYDYNARYYDPALGRFVQADTLVPGTDPQALNRYSYVLNNPLKYHDPSGHWYCGDQYDSSCIESEEEAMQYYKLTKDEMVLRRWGIAPGRPVPSRYQTAADNLHSLTVLFGSVELTISVVGTMGKMAILAGALLDGPEVGPADALAGVAAIEAYQRIIEPIENTLGWAGFVSTIAEDYLRGYNYWDEKSQQLVVGVDTVKEGWTKLSWS